jgi:hypothetical protein
VSAIGNRSELFKADPEDGHGLVNQLDMMRFHGRQTRE